MQFSDQIVRALQRQAKFGAFKIELIRSQICQSHVGSRKTRIKVQCVELID